MSALRCRSRAWLGIHASTIEMTRDWTASCSLANPDSQHIQIKIPLTATFFSRDRGRTQDVSIHGLTVNGVMRERVGASQG